MQYHIPVKLSPIKLALLAIGLSLMVGCDTLSNGVSADDMQKRQQALANSDRLIVPGQRIGPIRLGMYMNQVADILGQPDHSWNQYGNQVWQYNSLNLSIVFNTAAAPSVYSVSTTAFNDTGKSIGQSTWADENPVMTFFQTSNGVKLGSTSYDVMNNYGSYGLKDEQYVMRYNQLGITFWLLSDHRINLILVSQQQ